MHAPGVVAVAVAADIPGENNYGGVVHDDPIFADVRGAVRRAADVRGRRNVVRRGAPRGRACARSNTTELPAILDIRAALAAESYVLPSQHIVRGHPQAVLEKRAASPAWHGHDRRSGSFLSRRPDCDRAAAGRRRDAHSQLDAASDRSAAASSRTRWASERIASRCSAGAWAAASAARRARPR